LNKFIQENDGGLLTWILTFEPRITHRQHCLTKSTVLLQKEMFHGFVNALGKPRGK